MSSAVANVSVSLTNATTAAISISSCISSIPTAIVTPTFCAYDVPIPEVSQARSVVSVGVSDFLVLERGNSDVVYCYDTDNDGLADASRILAETTRLNHGLAVYDGYVYASSSTNVFRWKLATTTTTTTTASDNNNNNSNMTIVEEEEEVSYNFLEDVGEREIVVENINADGQGGAPFGHTTRTLAFDDLGRLYVSVGSNDNIDPDSFRSRIRRFPSMNATASQNLQFPLDFIQAEVFADGLRNEVGLAFDAHGVLWGVENSADRLNRKDIGGDIHEDNPAEELNRFKEEDAGKHWGYPWCWTEYDVPAPHGLGKGTIWAWPSFLEDGDITDDQCRNTEEYVGPALSLQGHSAPLGIVFYKYQPPEQRPESCPSHVAFPESMDGYAFIAYHGSWNRDVPTGYKVVYVPMNVTTGDVLDPTADPIDLLKHEPPNAKWEDGFRPVDVDFDDCGRLLISSDGTRNKGYAGSKIVRMEYVPPPQGSEKEYDYADSEAMQTEIAKQGPVGGGTKSSSNPSSSLSLPIIFMNAAMVAGFVASGASFW